MNNKIDDIESEDVLSERGGRCNKELCLIWIHLEFISDQPGLKFSNALGQSEPGTGCISRLGGVES